MDSRLPKEVGKIRGKFGLAKRRTRVNKATMQSPVANGNVAALLASNAPLVLPALGVDPLGRSSTRTLLP